MVPLTPVEDQFYHNNLGTDHLGDCVRGLHKEGTQ